MTAPYHLNTRDAQFLMGAYKMPADIRRMLLKKHVEDVGQEQFINMVSEFLALAHSVAENNREMIEMHLITTHQYYPTQAEKINLPTIFGALNGLTLAVGIDQDKLCHGCAYRVATCANQSPVTTCDADYQQQSSDMFWCHEEMKPDGSPAHKCRGFLQQRKMENAV